MGVSVFILQGLSRGEAVILSFTNPQFLILRNPYVIFGSEKRLYKVRPHR